MTGKISIVTIRHRIYTLEDEKLLQLAINSNFRYKFVPLIVYNKKTAGENNLSKPIMKSFNNEMPFILYELGTPIAILKSYMGGKMKKEDLISAKKAFIELKNFALQCSERVIADLCCQIILNEIKEKSDDQHVIFFIEKSASDKMLGRLASLYLNLDKITICFMVFDPSDLMTIVMSYQTGKLHFDINRLMSAETSEFFGPYPGDAEDSLTQTYFYKPQPLTGGGKYRPIRMDIFSQGLLRDMIDKKKNLIEKIFCPGSLNTEVSREENEPRLLIPIGFNELKNKIEREKKILFKNLEGDK